jgi:methyl-accepting chemotaxis protein
MPAKKFRIEPVGEEEMNVLSAPVAVIGGITLYVGIYHFFIYRKRKIKNPIDLSFALTCFTFALYDLFCVGAYNNTSLEAGKFWQHAQVATISLIGATFVWFVVDYSGRKSKKIRNYFAVIFILGALLTFFDKSGLSLQADKPAIKNISLPFHLGITYYEFNPGPLTQLLSVLGVLVFAYAFSIGIRLYREGDRLKARPLLWSVFFFCVGLCNDAAVQMKLYQSIYIIEYTYLGIVLMMAYFLSLEVVKSAENKEEVERAYNKLVETSHTLTGSSLQVSAVTRNIDDAMNEVFNGTLSQNDHIKNSHKTISDLLANIHSISREAQQGASLTQGTASRVAANIEAMKHTFDRIQIVERSVLEMMQIIETFLDHFKKIDVLVEFINEIASRINVLSLNVAIEATQSGTVNTGFMIVSKEIRQLARNTKAHTDEIDKVVTDFQGDMEKLRKAMWDGFDQFKQLTQLTDQSRTNLNDVLKLVEEEETRFRHISSKILDLRMYSQQVEKEMGTVANVSESNMKTAERVNASTKEMSSKMSELTQLADSLKKIASGNAEVIPKSA